MAFPISSNLFSIFCFSSFSLQLRDRHLSQATGHLASHFGINRSLLFLSASSSTPHPSPSPSHGQTPTAPSGSKGTTQCEIRNWKHAERPLLNELFAACRPNNPHICFAEISITWNFARTKFHLVKFLPFRNFRSHSAKVRRNFARGVRKFVLSHFVTIVALCNNFNHTL